MMQNKDKNEKIESKFLPTKFMLTIRVLVGAYLLYTSYSLIDGVVNGAGRDKYFLGFFMIAFTIIGILLMLFAGRDLLRGKYIGGELDAGDPDADGDEEDIVDTEMKEKAPEDETSEPAEKENVYKSEENE